VELLIDPGLFLRERVYTRDAKFFGCLALGFGAFSSRALMWEIGDGETLGIGAALRVVIALSWLFVPGKARQLPPQSATATIVVSRESKEYDQDAMQKGKTEMVDVSPRSPVLPGSSTPVTAATRVSLSIEETIRVEGQL